MSVFAVGTIGTVHGLTLMARVRFLSPRSQAVCLLADQIASAPFPPLRAHLRPSSTLNYLSRRPLSRLQHPPGQEERPLKRLSLARVGRTRPGCVYARFVGERDQTGSRARWKCHRRRFRICLVWRSARREDRLGAGRVRSAGRATFATDLGGFGEGHGVALVEKC
jgi:hypothetical protein